MQYVARIHKIRLKYDIVKRARLIKTEEEICLDYVLLPVEAVVIVLI